MDKKASNSISQVKELQTVTPDFAVKTPQKYSNLGKTTLNNGLEVYSYKLANGHRISIVPMENSPVIVKNYVNVGSMNETDDIKGISHFLEHMAFNGTTGKNGYMKLDTGDSFKKIDLLGGWTNASTNYAITDYVNSTPLLNENDLEEQIRIIASMTEDLALTKDMIEKEKGPVCSEINMILDDPQTILVDQTVRTLFNINSSADELVGGSTEHIKNLNREKVKKYYDKYYVPDNMNLVITGDVDPQKTIELVAKNFHSTKTRKEPIYEEKITPINKTIRKDFLSNKATSTEIMLAFSGPKNNDTKSKIIFDIVNEYLNSTNVGIQQELKKLNSSTNMGLEKISTNANNPTIVFYNFNSSEENSEKVLKLIYDKLTSIKSPSNEELEVIKKRLAIAHQNNLQYSLAVNNMIGNSIINGEFHSLEEYTNIINSITSDNVKNFIEEYLNLNKAAVVLVHPETSAEKIKENYNRSNNIAFKGTRKAINMDKVDTKTLKNNYKLGFYQTNNNNLYFSITLRHDIPENINPATIRVLNEILESGTINSSEEEFNKFLETNNIEISASASKSSFSLSGFTDIDNLSKTINKATELMYLPNINEEEINAAKNRIRDSLERTQDNSFSLYLEHESKNNPLYTSKSSLLANLDKVTTEDLKKLHEYIINNSTGTIVINCPVNNPEIKEISTELFENLLPVKPYKHRLIKTYSANQKPVVLTKDRPVSQADITQVHKFKLEKNIKETATLYILNTLLTSSSIGLFNVLREKEHLAYSVYSDFDKIGDTGEVYCNILTTTDNKEINEISYDNVKKSINGFNRQIKALINSEYTDDDLKSAKRSFKASLLNNEGVASKLSSLEAGISSKEGNDYYNQLYEEIDNITRDDIRNLALKVFQNPPVYSIIASKDTLEANKDFFETLEAV